MVEPAFGGPGRHWHPVSTTSTRPISLVEVTFPVPIRAAACATGTACQALTAVSPGWVSAGTLQGERVTLQPGQREQCQPVLKPVPRRQQRIPSLVANGRRFLLQQGPSLSLLPAVLLEEIPHKLPLHLGVSRPRHESAEHLTGLCAVCRPPGHHAERHPALRFGGVVCDVDEATEQLSCDALLSVLSSWYTVSAVWAMAFLMPPVAW